MTLVSRVDKPKTRKGRAFLENRAPKIFENDKRTLIIRGGHISEAVKHFLKDVASLKQPLVIRLTRRNPILPFIDISFVEKMCSKYDCSMFVIGLHSKKKPHNVIFGRLHDGELLDMFEMGIKNYKPLSSEQGPSVDKIRTLGVEHQFHFVLRSANELSFCVYKLSFQSSMPQKDTPDDLRSLSFLRTPQGKNVTINLDNALPSIDFELRREVLPSEEKWKRAHKVPLEVRNANKVQKNKNVDVFGSRVGQVHVGTSHELETLRPGATLRTALTGHRKRGFERPEKNNGRSSTPGHASNVHVSKSKRRKLYSEK